MCYQKGMAETMEPGWMRWEPDELGDGRRLFNAFKARNSGTTPTSSTESARFAKLEFYSAF